MYSECFTCKMQVLIENHQHDLSRGQGMRERHTDDMEGRLLLLQRWRGSVKG